MHSLKAIRTLFSIRLSVIIIFLTIVVTAVSGTVLYLYLSRTPLSNYYSGVISNVPAYKLELFKTSTYIYAVFALFMLIGVVILGIIYSHRVAGPLERVKVVSKELAAGRFDVNVKFRKHDVLHPLSDSINHMTERYRTRVSMLKDDVKTMEKGAHLLETALKSNDNGTVEKAINSLISACSDVEKTLSELK